MNIVLKPTLEEYFQKVSHEEVYRRYMPWDFKLNRLTRNPFILKDRNPSFIIGTKFGKITHKAFNTSHGGDCIKFVQEMFNLSRRDAIETIMKDIPINNRVIINNVIEEKEPYYSTIQVVTKKFTTTELNYWKEYYQELEDLTRENIYSVKDVYINKEKQYYSDITFGYYYPTLNSWKIYSPYEKKEKKWRTNVPFDYIEYLETINPSENCFISKSKKDKMVLQKALETNNICITQGESIACFSEENINLLNKNKENITVFDNDSTGVKNSLKLTELYNFKHCNVPYVYSKNGITDFADVCRNYGLLKIKKHFKEKQWI
jgi:hypothetical protein